MPDSSPILDLPYLLPAQAQKHVTHNAALARLDVLVQLSVAGFDADTPPAAPQEGEVHALGSAPTDAWAGQANSLAAWADGTWQFFSPRAGWRAWGRDAGELRIWDGGAWVLPTARSDDLDHLGIGTTADAANRLTVQAGATLLTHDGAGHRLKINKAGAGDTASLLFQSGWTGHAEMGLTGDTDFSVKLSPDGSTWIEALRFDPATGHASGAAVQNTATDTTAGRLMRADYGYSPGNLLGTVSEASGTPAGAVIERGANANGEYMRLADGTQICWHVLDMGSIIDSGAGTRGNPYRTAGQTWTFPAAFVASPALGAIGRVAATNDARRAVSASYRLTSATAATDLMVYRNSDDATDNNADLDVVATGRWF